MCAWVKHIALRLASVRHGLYLHLRAGFGRGFIRFALSLKVIPSGTCRVCTNYHVSSQQTTGSAAQR
jgi:hypothetical protein